MKSLIVPVCRSSEETLRINPKRIRKIQVGHNLTKRESDFLLSAEKLRIQIEKKAKSKNALEGLWVHLHPFEYDSICAYSDNQPGQRHVILALDGIEDPHNFGAIVRTAAFMGVKGIVLPKDRSADVTEAAYRVASGGFEYISVCQATNLATALEQLKEYHYWIVGLSEYGDQKLQQISIDTSIVLVIGNEERGLRERTRSTCDILARMDAPGRFTTLNASVASALAMSWAVNFR